MGILRWLWRKGVIKNFLAGLFFVLPLALTIAVMIWLVEKVERILGKDSIIGNLLQGLGSDLTGLEGETISFIVGWAMVIASIWVLGIFINYIARTSASKIWNGLLTSIPIFGTVYKPIAQIVGLLKGSTEDKMKGMKVVFCSFGSENGAQFLALLASEQIYCVGDKKSVLIYIPTSPVPMSGGLIFVPKETIELVEGMSVDDLMKIYFSIGVLTPDVFPKEYKMDSTVT